MKTPIVDADHCIGCGLCTEIAPEVFELNDDNIAVVKDPAGAPEKIIQQAISECPVDAISWG